MEVDNGNGSTNGHGGGGGGGHQHAPSGATDVAGLSLPELAGALQAAVGQADWPRARAAAEAMEIAVQVRVNACCSEGHQANLVGACSRVCFAYLLPPSPDGPVATGGRWRGRQRQQRRRRRWRRRRREPAPDDGTGHAAPPHAHRARPVSSGWMFVIVCALLSLGPRGSILV